MATYEVHKSSNNDFSIKVVTPTSRDITINADMITKKLTITIPQGTKMGIGTSVGDSGKYFHFNYFSFITIEFNNGTIIPARNTIKTLFEQGSGIDNSTYYPSLSEFKKFSNNVIIFHYGADTSNGYECPNNWYHELASDKKIIVDIPSGASSFNAYVGGCSINSTACRRYIYDTWYNTPTSNGGYGGNNGFGESLANWGIPAWLSAELTSATKNTIVSGNAGGNTCNASWSACDHDDNAIFNWFTPTDNQLWSNVTQGSVTSITDNKNNTITITTSAGSNGSNNTISSETVHYKFSNGTTGSYTRVNTKSDIPIPFGATSVEVWIVTVSQRQGNLIGAVKKANIIYYEAPSSASSAKLYYISDNKSSETDSSLNPRLNKQLTWEWSGFSPGTTNTQDVIKGFRLFLYKDPLSSSLTTGPTKYYYDSNHNLQVSTNTTLKGTSLPLLQNKPSNVIFDVIYKDSNGTATKITSGITSIQTDATTTECIDIDIPSGKTTNGSGSLTIIPKEFGFEKNDYCICEVGAYSKNGAGTKLFNGYQVKSCKLKSSANVWVKTTDSTDSSAWKEAESIWVKTSSGWKEAEGLWVKTASDTWSESS